MSVHSCDVGTLEYVHNGQNLKLRTNVKINLSPSNGFSHPFALPSDLESLICAGTWIAGGNRLQMQVEIILDDIVVSQSSGGNIMEDIGVMLCNAEVLHAESHRGRTTNRRVDLDSASPQCVSQIH